MTQLPNEHISSSKKHKRKDRLIIAKSSYESYKINSNTEIHRRIRTRIRPR